MEAMAAAGREFRLRIVEEGTSAGEVEAIALDSEAAAELRRLFAAGRPVELRAPSGDASDVEGHALAANAIVVMVAAADDVEGHALALRFPSVRDAQEFQRRLLATGVIAGALVVGVVGVNVADTSPAATGAGAAGAPAVVQPRSVTDDVGIMDASGAAISGATQSESRSVTDDVGLMDASGAAITDEAAAPDTYEKHEGTFRGR